MSREVEPLQLYPFCDSRKLFHISKSQKVVEIQTSCFQFRFVGKLLLGTQVSKSDRVFVWFWFFVWLGISLFVFCKTVYKSNSEPTIFV